MIFVSVQPSSTTLFGMPFPLPTDTPRARIRNPESCPSAKFECCATLLLYLGILPTYGKNSSLILK